MSIKSYTEYEIEIAKLKEENADLNRIIKPWRLKYVQDEDIVAYTEYLAQKKTFDSQVAKYKDREMKCLAEVERLKKECAALTERLRINSSSMQDINNLPDGYRVEIKQSKMNG